MLMSMRLDAHVYAYRKLSLHVYLRSLLEIPNSRQKSNTPEKKLEQLSRCNDFLEPPASTKMWMFVMTTHRFYCPTLSHVPVSDNKYVRFSAYPQPRCRRMRLCMRRCMNARKLEWVSIHSGSNMRVPLSRIDLTLTNE